MEALTKSGDNEYIGIDDGEGILANGGMQNMFFYDPIETKQAVAAGLFQQQENIIQNIYEITGISDIMRNISPEETATATVAKGRFGSLRLRERQACLNNYVKSIYKIAAELVCELFSIPALQEITSIKLPSNQEKMQYELEMKIQEDEYKLQQIEGMQMGQEVPPPPVDKKQQKFFELPTWEDVKEFLENNKLRNYLIDVETTFNAWENEKESQANAIELLEVFTDSTSKLLPLIAQAPDLTDAFLGVLGGVLDKFRMPRRIRNSIDDSFTQMIENVREAMENPQPQPPQPEQMIAESEVMRAIRV
ncbi:hypothetical protein AGMMS49995_11180 [Endomicrobiia bacterium]|nr:hypothetical protein AGMMS49995_11180 [Endomicrobiia bacterium]